MMVGTEARQGAGRGHRPGPRRHPGFPPRLPGCPDARSVVSLGYSPALFNLKPSTLYADLAVAPESCQFVGLPSAKAKATAWIVGCPVGIRSRFTRVGFGIGHPRRP